MLEENVMDLTHKGECSDNQVQKSTEFAIVKFKRIFHHENQSKSGHHSRIVNEENMNEESIPKP